MADTSLPLSTVEQSHVSSDSALHGDWPRLTRVAFRFAFCYWILYIWPSPGAVSLLDLIPWLGDKIGTAMFWPMKHMAPWVGQHWFHLTGPGADWHPTGSGDTAMNYVQLLLIAIFAVVAATVWSVISEVRGKRREYRTAYAWLRLVLRFTLAITLLEYGFIKIFPGQFGPLDLYGLSESYGDSTPMHLLWTFMGQSRPYMIFGGLMEAVPGALLLFRRTSTAGLLAAAAVMTNVVVMNFCYDVTVKLYSAHLLLMALFLLLPDMMPLWRFVIERKPAQLTGVWLPRWERKPLRVGTHVLQGLVLVGVLYSVVYQTYEETKRPAVTPTPLYGGYDVDKTDGWAANQKVAKVFFEDSYLILKLSDQRRRYLALKNDFAKQTAEIVQKGSGGSFHWTKGDKGLLTLAGTVKGEPFLITAHKVTQATSDDKFELNSRGFHWVQEQAYNH